MILYDWKKMFNFGEGSVAEVYRIFKMWSNREIPTSRRDPIYKYAGVNFSGISFLLHDDVLLYNSYKHEKRDIVQYVALASYRNLADYKAHGTITLDRYDAPDIEEDLFHHNELLTLTDENKVRFLYEETPKHIN